MSGLNSMGSKTVGLKKALKLYKNVNFFGLLTRQAHAL
jgi:hypothetical protein